MRRHVLVAVQAWGDNVVSMRLLRDLRGQADLGILGTDLTRELAWALGFGAFPITVIGHVTSAVYNVAQAGLWRAAQDFRVLGRAIRQQAGDDATVLFENYRRRGTHKLLQLCGKRFAYEQPEYGASAYEGRRRMFERALGVQIDLPLARAPQGPVKRVVVAPSARMRFRMFPEAVVNALIVYAEKHDWEICLLDAYEDYLQFRDRVSAYVSRQPVATSIDLIRQADLAVVADSLFLHVAYYLGRPAVAVVPEFIERAFYFAPPGLQEGGLYLPFGRALDQRLLFAHLDRLIT